MYLSHCSTRFAFNHLFVHWVTTLTPRCHVTSLVTWPLEPHMVLSYWWSVDAKSLSRTVAEMLSFKHFEITTLTLSGHVTSSVTWPLEPQMVISYWSPIDNMSLSPTIAEILSVIVLITIFPLQTHWKPILGIFGGGIGDYAIFSNLSLAAAERRSLNY